MYTLCTKKQKRKTYEKYIKNTIKKHFLYTYKKAKQKQKVHTKKRKISTENYTYRCISRIVSVQTHTNLREDNIPIVAATQKELPLGGSFFMRCNYIAKN